MNLYYNTSDWQPATLTLIAARPAVGKTPFMVSMAKNMAEKHSTPVVFFTLEMSQSQIEWCLGPASGSGAPIHIDDTANLTLADLHAKARQLVKEEGIKLIMIDYLQLLVIANREEGEEKVAPIIASLKALAVELNIPIIISSLLSRRKDADSPLPTLSEIKEYDAIKDNVDTIAFLYRPEYYTPVPYDTSRLELFVAHSKYN